MILLGVEKSLFVIFKRPLICCGSLPVLRPGISSELPLSYLRFVVVPRPDGSSPRTVCPPPSSLVTSANRCFFPNLLAGGFGAGALHGSAVCPWARHPLLGSLSVKRGREDCWDRMTECMCRTVSDTEETLGKY